MKYFFTALMIATLVVRPESSMAKDGESDTVIIELNNKSKILIYTDDRASLEDLQQYDINKMLKDINLALESKKIQRVEMADKDGKKYLKDTTVILGDGASAKSKIRIGNMELLVDADEWEDVEDEWNEDIPVKKYQYEEEAIDRTRHYFNIDFGINNWLDNGKFPDADGQPYSVKPWGSWYIALNSVNRTWLSGPLFLEWGGGVSWYNWKMQNTDVMISKGTERIEFTDQTIYNGKKSKLTAPYINLSVVPVVDFAKGRRQVKNLERGSVKFRTYKKQGIRFGLGGYVGYRLGGHTKFVYDDEDGKKQKDKDRDNFYLTNVRYGIRGQIGYKGLDLFVMYDLNNVFANDRGPEGSNGLNAITFGITL